MLHTEHTRTEHNEMYLKSNCKPLDELLGGGIEKGTITEVYGEGGSGKTNMCLLFAKTCVQNGKKVIYIDTEGVSTIRMEQVFGEETARIMGEILLFKPYSLEEQAESLIKARNLVEKLDVGLVVIDTVTIFYRKDFNKDGNNKGKRNRHLLAKMMIEGLSLARRTNIPLLLANQVYTDIENNRFEPVGGHMINHNAKAIIELRKMPDGLRKAVVVKHRSIKSGSWTYFKITKEGLGEAGFNIPEMGAWSEDAYG